MSLLLDARRKIELALDQTGVHKAVEPQLTETLRLEDHPSSTAPQEAPPPAPKPPEGRASGSAPAGARDDPRAAGKNLFAAKSAPTREGRRLGIIPIALISGTLLAAGGGYYVWREITPSAQAPRQYSKPPPAAPIVNAVPPPAPAPAVPAQESMPAAPLAATEAPAQISLTPPLQRGGAAGDAVADMATAPDPSLRKGRATAVGANAGLAATSLPPLQKGERGGFAAQPKQETAPLAQNETVEEEALATSTAPGIRFERGPQQANPVAPALLAAWQAYQDGDLGAAGQRYGEILKLDAKNRDALLGMAAIAQQQARDDEAAYYYRQVLALDPRDPVAHAGMLSLLARGNEAGVESRLKLLLAQQSQSPALHFALGNLYAEQSRWSDAQQSYFSASNLEPDNAQFAFNLAVSLDHLGKSGLAVQHYRRALQLDGAAKPSRIDRTQTQRRLNDLTATP